MTSTLPSTLPSILPSTLPSTLPSAGTKRDKRRARLHAKKADQTDDLEFLDNEIAKNRNHGVPDTPVDDKTNKPKTVESTPLSTSSQELSIDELIKKLDTLWAAVKKHVKATPEFKELDDKKKLDFFRKSFPTEMDEHPIVTRYMICLGQYRSKAFRRMLEKTKRMVHPPPEKRDKGYMEEQWIRRQADYVQYLWEEYQRGHYSMAERNWVYQEAYNRLKGEFDDFRDMHKEVEKRIEEEKKSLAGRNVRDLLIRLKTGKQQLSEEEQTFLRQELRKVLIKSNFRVVLKQLKETRKETEPTCVATGKGEEVDERKKQITVFENGVLQPDQNVSDVYDASEPKPVGYTGPVTNALGTIYEQPSEYTESPRPAIEQRADNLE